MSNWSTNRATIVTAIETEDSNYKLIPGNKEPEDSVAPQNDKYYSLKLLGIGTTQSQAPNIISFSHRVMLKIKYNNIDSTIRITNEGLFTALIKAIGGLSEFGAFLGEPEIEDLDDKHIQGTMEFWFGEDNNS